MEPGRTYALEIDMHVTSWVFPRGHRIRLAVNNAQWPMIWPTPYPMTTRLHLGGENPTRIILPVVPHADRPRPNFPPPAEDPKLPGHHSNESELSSPSGYAEVSTVKRDFRSGTTTVVLRNGGGGAYPWGSGSYSEIITYEGRDDRPDIASVSSEYERTFRLEGRLLTWQGLLLFRSDRSNFYYTYTRRLLRDGGLVREKTWEEVIERDHQ